MHLLKNFQGFFTKGEDAFTINGMYHYMLHLCKSPQRLMDFTDMVDRLTDFSFSGRKERLLNEKDSSIWSLKALVHLNSCFLLLNNAD